MSQERRQGKVVIPVIGRFTKIFGTEKNQVIHWEVTEHSDRLSGHGANTGSVPKSRRVVRRWMAKTDMVEPGSTTRAGG